MWNVGVNFQQEQLEKKEQIGKKRNKIVQTAASNFYFYRDASFLECFWYLEILFCS